MAPLWLVAVHVISPAPSTLADGIAKYRANKKLFFVSLSISYPTDVCSSVDILTLFHHYGRKWKYSLRYYNVLVSVCEPQVQRLHLTFIQSNVAATICHGLHLRDKHLSSQRM